MSVMDAMDDLLTAIDGLQTTVNKVAPRRDPDLQWWTDTDLPFGWKCHHGYSIDWDDGRAGVWIHKSELDDGKACVLVHLPAEDINKLESVIAEEVEAAYQDDALARQRDDGDYGDWLYEQQKDREALR